MVIEKFVLRFENGEQTAKLGIKELEHIFLEFCSLTKDCMMCRRYKGVAYHAITHISYDGSQWKIEDDHYYTSIHKEKHTCVLNHEIVIIKRKYYDKPSKNFGYF